MSYEVPDNIPGDAEREREREREGGREGTRMRERERERCRAGISPVDWPKHDEHHRNTPKPVRFVDAL